MLCSVCIGMLHDGKGEVWTGTFDLTFQHHRRPEALRHSAEAGCLICMSLARAIGNDINPQKVQEISIRAILRKTSSKHKESDGTIFRLDFDLGNNRWRTFLLTEIGK
jgi:hypothetical protein